MADEENAQTPEHIEFVTASTSAEDHPEANEDGRVEGGFELNYGEDLAEAQSLYGHDAVYEMYIRGTRIRAQQAIRTLINGGVETEKIPERLADWTPETTVSTPKDPVSTAEKAFDQMDEEEQQDFLQRLRERQSS